MSIIPKMGEAEQGMELEVGDGGGARRREGEGGGTGVRICSWWAEWKPCLLTY
jgi:hypothetical protein